MSNQAYKSRYDQIDWSTPLWANPERVETKSGIQIIKDIEPFISPVDMKVVGSRAARREHNKVHGVIDVGNEQNHASDRPVMDRAAPDIRRAIGELR